MTDNTTDALTPVEERIVDFKFPFDISIDSGSVGGPSAGLAFTLAVLDVLTPGELTGGHRIAVTGGTPLPPRYFALFRRWLLFGIPGFGSVMAILWLMIAKPF